MHVPSSRNPPAAGPTMRLALLAPTSSDIAVLIRSRPTTSPIITRRTGLSVHQPHLLMKLASASCQISSCPVRPRSARTAEVPPIRSTTTRSVRPRSSVRQARREKTRTGPSEADDDQADIPQEPEVRRTGLDHSPERRAASFGDGIGDLTVAQVPIPFLLSQGRG